MKIILLIFIPVLVPTGIMSAEQVKSKILKTITDNPHIRLALSEIVERFGYSPVAPPNGEDVITKFQGSTYNLIIADMKMPKMDGTTFIREVKSMDENVLRASYLFCHILTYFSETYVP